MFLIFCSVVKALPGEFEPGKSGSHQNSSDFSLCKRSIVNFQLSLVSILSVILGTSLSYELTASLLEFCHLGA